MKPHHHDIRLITLISSQPGHTVSEQYVLFIATEHFRNTEQTQLHFLSMGGTDVCSTSCSLKELLPFLVNGGGRGEQGLLGVCRKGGYISSSS